MRSGVGLGPVPGLCLLAKRRERRFPEAEQSIAKPRSADYPKIAAGGICLFPRTGGFLSRNGPQSRARDTGMHVACRVAHAQQPFPRRPLLLAELSPPRWQLSIQKGRNLLRPNRRSRGGRRWNAALFACIATGETPVVPVRRQDGGFPS